MFELTMLHPRHEPGISPAGLIARKHSLGSRRETVVGNERTSIMRLSEEPKLVLVRCGT